MTSSQNGFAKTFTRFRLAQRCTSSYRIFGYETGLQQIQKPSVNTELPNSVLYMLNPVSVYKAITNYELKVGLDTMIACKRSFIAKITIKAPELLSRVK